MKVHQIYSTMGRFIYLRKQGLRLTAPTKYIWGGGNTGSFEKFSTSNTSYFWKQEADVSSFWLYYATEQQAFCYAVSKNVIAAFLKNVYH